MTVLGKPFSHLMDTVVDIDALVHKIAKSLLQRVRAHG